jgi:hypothetical protein
MLAVTSSSGNQRFVDRKSNPVNWAGSKRILSEEAFHQMLALEQKRTARTKRPFGLLLVHIGQSFSTEKDVGALLSVLSILQAATRDTDLVGWHEANISVGVMLTEITLDNDLLLNVILSRINTILQEKLTAEQFSHLQFSCQLVPESGRVDLPFEKRHPLPTDQREALSWAESEQWLFSNSKIG